MKNMLVLITIVTSLWMQIWADENATDFTTPLTEQHKLLQRGVGKWKIEQKMWFDPSQEPVTATGTSVCKSILEGRGSIVFVETQSEAGTFKGFGVFTWDVVNKKFECSWVDVYSYSGIDSMEGVYDAESDVLTWIGKFTDPQTGQEFTMSMVETFPNEDTMVAEFYIHMGEQKTKTMVNTYTRIKKPEAKVENSSSSAVEVPVGKQE